MANLQPKDNLLGKTFSRLTVLEFHSVKKRKRYWLCKCICGEYVIAGANQLKIGDKKSCGCLLKESVSKRTTERNTSHGMSSTPEFKAWIHMRERCFNKNNRRYKNYGLRKITVCDRWINSFENFISDMGKKPSSKHSIDRINNDGNYEPENCKWSTNREQSINKTTTKLENINGKMMCRTDVIKLLGISTETFYRYIKLGYNSKEIKEVFERKRLLKID